MNKDNIGKAFCFLPKEEIEELRNLWPEGVEVLYCTPDKHPLPMWRLMNVKDTFEPFGIYRPFERDEHLESILNRYDKAPGPKPEMNKYDRARLDGAPYGYCPVCGARATGHEGGDNICLNGHLYPSCKAVYPETVVRELPKDGNDLRWVTNATKMGRAGKALTRPWTPSEVPMPLTVMLRAQPNDGRCTVVAVNYNTATVVVATTAGNLVPVTLDSLHKSYVTAGNGGVCGKCL
jgi:hypothetical protein